MDPTSNAAPEGLMGDISNQQASVITTWIIMTALAAVAVSMRFYTRRLILHILGPEDWLILAALVFAFGACVGFVRRECSPCHVLCLTSNTHLNPETFFGMGQHVGTLTPEMSKQWQMVRHSQRARRPGCRCMPTDNSIASQKQFYSLLFHTISLGITKMSILCLYMRVMVYGAPRIAVYVVLGFTMMCNSWVLVASFIQCIPLEALWDSDVEGSCLGNAVTIGSSIIHIITDFIIFALPIPTLASLRIHRRQKIGLLGVFSIGFL